MPDFCKNRTDFLFARESLIFLSTVGSEKSLNKHMQVPPHKERLSKGAGCTFFKKTAGSEESLAKQNKALPHE